MKPILTLRYRILLAFIFLLLATVVFFGLAYQRHLEIQRKLQFVEEADDLRNCTLEARRYEKNLLLYGGLENYQELIRYLAQAEQQLNLFKKTWPGEIELVFLNEALSVLDIYRQTSVKYFEAFRRGERGNTPEIAFFRDMLRESGRQLTENVEAMVLKERRRVDELVAYQKRSLFYSSGGVLIVAIFMSYYLFFQIFRPLSAIQTAASDIAAGKVHEIRQVQGALEIRSLVAVLNEMIRELDRKSEKLIQQEKMASLGTLTSGVAHELNNPLSNISTSTQILIEELGEVDLDFQKTLLAGIEEQVEKARDIVRSLLEFAREGEFEVGRIGIRELIEKTLRLVRGELPAEVEVRLDVPEPFEVEVDQRRLSQALINLMLNGVQAMTGAGGVLKIGAYRQERDDGFRIEVEDNGPGIPPDIINHVFDPFFTTKHVGKGTGLGLYVTYGIIQKHNGRIDVNSRPGEGAKFIISLPIHQHQAA